jgi:hypothetical protein
MGEAERQTRIAIREETDARVRMWSAAQKTQAMTEHMHETMRNAGVTTQDLATVNNEQLNDKTEMLRTVARDMDRELGELTKICENGAAWNNGVIASRPR